MANQETTEHYLSFLKRSPPPMQNHFVSLHTRTCWYVKADFSSQGFLRISSDRWGALQGMDFTTDKLRSLVRKWQSLIEAYVDVKTTDGYVLRLFCIGFTKKRDQQVKRTCYAQSSQIRQIRKKMVEIMTREAACELKELVSKFIPEVIGKPERTPSLRLDYPAYSPQYNSKLERQPKMCIGCVVLLILRSWPHAYLLEQIQPCALIMGATLFLGALDVSHPVV